MILFQSKKDISVGSGPMRRRDGQVFASILSLELHTVRKNIDMTY